MWSAVDDSYVYWTAELSNTAGMDAIGRATIDGNPASVNNTFVTGATFIANSSLPSGVAVDDSYLYWGPTHQRGPVQARRSTRQSAGRTSNGPAPTLIFCPGPTFPISIALDPATPPDRTLTVSTSGTGTGTVTGAGIDCGGAGHVDCTETVADGTQIARPHRHRRLLVRRLHRRRLRRRQPVHGDDERRQVGRRQFTAPPPPQRTLTVTTSGTGTGTVTGTGIDCGGAGHADCTETVADGTQIALTATATGGSSFAGFTGGGCGTKAPARSR